MTIRPQSRDLPVAMSRAERGRWLGGVCAGLARARGLSVHGVRAGFVLAALAGGLGVLVYIACWLIIPAEGDAGDEVRSRGIVALAQVCAACAGLATLGVAGAGATVFGFGWVVVALASAILLSALAFWPRSGPVWALLPVAALVLPSVALAAGGVRVEPQTGHVTVAPSAISAVPHGGYRSGLGTLLVDLRHTTIPVTGESLRIDAGVRRTIVALPHDRCVSVDVRFHIVPFAARVAAVVAGRTNELLSQVVVFGEQRYGRSGETGYGAAPRSAPALVIDFTSAGGGLYVRDYPDDVNPESMPDWPGDPVPPDLRPEVGGLPRAAARALRQWRARREIQVRSQRHADALRRGPCRAKADPR